MQDQDDKLIKYFKIFNVNHSFKEGELVRWKQGMKNRIKPRYDEPMVVLEVLDKPVISESKESGSTYFREPLDIVLGRIDDDGDFVSFYYDSRRFEPFK